MKKFSKTENIKYRIPIFLANLQTSDKVIYQKEPRK